jgi:hypothetical protein
MMRSSSSGMQPKCKGSRKKRENVLRNAREHQGLKKDKGFREPSWQ